MTAVAIVFGAWMAIGLVSALVLGRMIRTADDQAEPDWLWDQPTDILSDAAVRVRFDEIVGALR